MHKATRIIAIRHGETAWNVETRLQGHTDIALNTHGTWQAERAALALADEDIAAIYTSDLSRARATAEAIAQRSSQDQARAVRPTPGLRERGFGVLEGHTYAQIAERWPDESERWRRRDPDFAPPGGESLLQVRTRVADTVHALAQAHTGEQIVLVAHGGVLDTLYRLATGQDLQAPRTWDLGNTAINRLLWTSDSLTVVGWADTRHLDTALLDETNT